MQPCSVCQVLLGTLGGGQLHTPAPTLCAALVLPLGLDALFEQVHVHTVLQLAWCCDVVVQAVGVVVWCCCCWGCTGWVEHGVGFIEWLQHQQHQHS